MRGGRCSCLHPLFCLPHRLRVRSHEVTAGAQNRYDILHFPPHPPLGHLPHGKTGKDNTTVILILLKALKLFQYVKQRVFISSPGVAGADSIKSLHLYRRGGWTRTAPALAICILISFPLYAETDEQKSYNHIKGIPVSDHDRFESESSAFIKKYPKSTLVPDVMLLQAQRESSIDLAVEKYRAIVKNYPSYKKRAYALYLECQVLELKSRWKELEAGASMGIKLFPSGEYACEFRIMRATALLMREKYDACREECAGITENTHDYDMLSRALFLGAEAERRISGNSKSYINGIRELVAGFRDSSVYPSILFRLGTFYEEKKDYDKAYSVFRDITEQFPKSPEADLAKARIASLKKYKPQYVKYMPDQKTVDSADTIDIQPEYERESRHLPVYYSVSVGPFTKKREAEKITALMDDYDDTRIEKTSSGYTIFTGRYEDQDEALAAKIRLAEEFGINGEIVRFSEKNSRSYIYGD